MDDPPSRLAILGRRIGVTLGILIAAAMTLFVTFIVVGRTYDSYKERQGRTLLKSTLDRIANGGDLGLVSFKLDPPDSLGDLRRDLLSGYQFTHSDNIFLGFDFEFSLRAGNGAVVSCDVFTSQSPARIECSRLCRASRLTSGCNGP